MTNESSIKSSSFPPFEQGSSNINSNNQSIIPIKIIISDQPSPSTLPFTAIQNSFEPPTFSVGKISGFKITTIMSSSLRFSVSASSSSPQPIPLIQRTISSPPSKKQKMSLTQTYYLAHTARGKLSKEASRSDHNLHRLVGHANLLDGLMLDLADAEREQESWFNNTVRGAAKASEEPKHIQWAETIEESMDEDDESDTETLDSDSDSDDEEIHYAKNVSFHRRSSQSATTITAMELDDGNMEDDEDYEDDLALTRTSSHPPELLHESDSESEDDSMPPSPPQPEIHLDAFSEKQREAIATTSFYQSIPDDSTSSAALPPSEQAAFFDEGFYLPQRQQTTIISSY